MTMIDLTATTRALALHYPSGDLYVVEHAPIREAGECTGARMVAATDALDRRRDLGLTGPLPTWPDAALFDRIDSLPGLGPVNVDWLTAEEAAGRLFYPLGSR